MAVPTPPGGFWAAGLQGTPDRMNWTLVQADTIASRPAASTDINGAKFLSTDESPMVLYEVQAGSWVSIAEVHPTVTSDQHHAQNHAARHGSGGADAVSAGGLVAGADPRSSSHASRHSDGGADEVTAENLATAISSGQVLEGDGAGGLQAATPLKMATGTYTGDGTTSQAITGLGFAPKYMRIWRRFTSQQDITEDQYIVEATDTIVDDHADGLAWGFYGGDEYRPFQDGLISLDADGFTVDDGGWNENPNINTMVYNYLAIG